MKKSALLLVAVLTLTGLGIWMLKKPKIDPLPVVTDESELPVNTIPISERPFMTLSPDDSGRNLILTVDGAPTVGEMEYELVYSAADKQEGVFGRLDLESEQQPIEKTLLLGSKSGGGKVTYHEGVTGGSMTVTYEDTRLKEQWNFLHFDPTDPVVSAPDARFSMTLPKTALKKDKVVIMMKPFGLPAGLSAGAKVVAGPYAFLTASPVKGAVAVELKLPAGEYINPQILAYDSEVWLPLKTTVDGETLSASAENASIFIAVSQ